MNIRKIAGTGCIVFGALNILNFWSPIPVPTVGPSAFIVGGLFLGLGLFLRAPRGESGRIAWDRLANLFRVDGAVKRKATLDAADPLLSVRILRLASESKGKLTVSHAAISLNVSLDNAQAALEECVIKGAAYIDVDGKTGVTGYYFPEFLPES